MLEDENKVECTLTFNGKSQFKGILEWIEEEKEGEK